jgi:hypothetical protein
MKTETTKMNPSANTTADSPASTAPRISRRMRREVTERPAA